MRYRSHIKVFQAICLMAILTWFSPAAAQSIQSRIRPHRVPTEQVLATNTQNGIDSYHTETPQIAPWKEGYALTYVDIQRRSWLMFLDRDFRKISPEYPIRGKVVFQLITDNNELALLTAKRRCEDEECYYVELYFTRVDEKGKILLDRHLVGGPDIKQPGETELDNIGNYRMIWDRDRYIATFPMQHNFSDNASPDIHQGDGILFISPQGEITVLSDWENSHSFQQFPLAGEDHVIHLAKGDGPRGLLAAFYTREMEADEYEDAYIPLAKTYYEPEDFFGSNPYPIPGGNGDNYVPYMIGDGIVMEKDVVMVIFSTKHQRNSYDIGLIKVYPKDNGFSKIHWLTNTPGLYEHSPRIVRLGADKLFITWRRFDPKKGDRTIKALEEKYWDEDDDEDLIMREVNLDQQMAAITDLAGNFLDGPEKLRSHFYCAADWMEYQTEWNHYLATYFDHCWSPIIEGQDGGKVWLYHEPFGKEIIVSVLED